MKSFAVQLFQSVLTIALSVWIILCLFLYFMQSSYIYYPYAELTATPREVGLDFNDVSLITRDDKKIHGWYIAHPAPRATLLFLHGNAGNISHRLEKILIYHQLGIQVFIIDYRGYGQSEGTPSEEGTYLDAEAAWHYLTREKNIPEKSIILYGESLGAAVATWLGVRYSAGALIIESGFTSIESIAKHYYPYLPVSLITRIKYPSLERIMRISSPTLVVHSVDDEIIPFTHAVELYDSAIGPKSLLKLSGDHNNGFDMSGRLYKDGLDSFISTLF
jgi:uncharacterized protein